MTTLPVVEACPKSMLLGPCGGVSMAGACEIDDVHACLFLEPERTRVRDADERAALDLAAPREADALPDSGLRHSLTADRFTIITEVNGPDGVDTTGFLAAAQAIAAVSDAVSITDNSGANVHMSTLAAAATMRRAGIEVVATFACRDRNRIALQSDLLGAAALGVQNILCVTGNHVQVGDSPGARPVFDLDGSRLVAMADRMRRLGRYDNGRALDDRPRLLIGAPAHPFAPPYDERPAHVLRKVRLGADYVISQHVFDLPRWRAFVEGVNALRGGAAFSLLGGIAILPDGETARKVNAGLRGFTIPEPVLARLDQSRDPVAEGIEIAAETLAELVAQEGVTGCLLAPVVTRTSNPLAASMEQAEIIAAVRERAGVGVGVH